VEAKFNLPSLHSYNLRRVNVDIPRIQKDMGLNVFDVSAAQAWNYLSKSVKCAPQWEGS